MPSIIALIIPALFIAMGPVLTRLAYRRADDGGPAKVPHFFRTAWVLPMAVALLNGLVGFMSLFSTGPTNGLMWELVFMDLLVPVAFLEVYLVTRDSQDRTTFFIMTTIWAVLCAIATALPAFATTYLAYKRSPLTHVAVVLAGGFPFVALAFALYERKGVATRAFKRVGVDISGEVPSPTAGVGFRKIWFLPMVLPALFGALVMLGMIAAGIIDVVIIFQVALDLLVPLAFLQGYLATRTRRERVALLVSAALWVALVAVVAIVLSTNSPYLNARAPQAIITALVLCFYPIASLLYALWRRKDIIDVAQRRIDGVVNPEAAKRGSRRVDADVPTDGGTTGRRADAPGTSRAATRALFESALGVGQDVASGAEVQSGQVREEVEGVGQRHAAATHTEQVATGSRTGATAASVTTAIAAAGVPEVATTVGTSTTATVVTPASSAVATPANAARKDSVLVDVNKCSEMDLLALPGITVAIAKAVVAERVSNGAYASVEDFVRRNSLKPHLVVMFIDNLTCSRPAGRSSSGRRSRTLDL